MLVYPSGIPNTENYPARPPHSTMCLTNLLNLVWNRLCALSASMFVRNVCIIAGRHHDRLLPVPAVNIVVYKLINEHSSFRRTRSSNPGSILEDVQLCRP